MKQSKNILEIITWFDIFDWPLTKIEILKYCELSPTSNPKLQFESIENFNGFYFLKNRKEIIEKRISRQKIAIKKIKTGKFGAEILSFIPFIKMVAICNDLAYFNAPENSDVDFFIIVKSGRIWTTRFLSTAILFALGLWRHGKKIKDRICLSFFICDDKLDLKEISYDGDVYLNYWILQILPLFDKDRAYQKFLNENSWVTNNYPNFFQFHPSHKIEISQNNFQKFFEKILNGWLGNILEKFLRSLQLKIMEKRKLARLSFSKKNFGGEKNVIISDKMLKFHERDRRKYFRDIYKKELLETNGNL